MNPSKRRQIFERLRAANPDPQSELAHQTPFELLVAVVLSAQATDKGVNKATDRLYRIANTPAAIVKLGVEGLIPYISSIGLFNMKARNVVALSQILLDAHRGEVPRNRDALEKLPGVGRKTANVVMNVAFGDPTIAVDTHVFRVANRTGLAPGRDPLEVELRLLKFTPDEFRLHAHHWLILHGRYVCVARLPKCPQCVIADLCEYRDKTPALPGMPALQSLPLKPAPKSIGEEPAAKPRRAKKSAPKATGRKQSAANSRDANKPAAKVRSRKRTRATRLRP